MPAARSAHSGEVVQDWVLEQCIGSGSFATVWKAHKLASESSVAAIKIISTDKLSTKLKQSLECEVSILKRVSHGNVVKLYDVVEAHNRLYLVMEYCGGGDLADYIRRHQRVQEIVAKGLLQQLAKGLQELWRHHFVHRDLKPQNLLLLDTTSAPTVKIADFGFARDLQPQRLADTLCGSPLYMAPEILQFHKYDAKADLWSVGIILYELVVGRTPFDGGNHVQLLRNIERNEARVPDPIARSLSPHCTGLISQLLKCNPVERISFEEFFAHPFLLPGETPATSVLEPSAPPGALSLPAGALPTIASGIVLPLERSSLPEEGRLPFSVDVEQRAVGKPNFSGNRPIRMASVPSSPVTRPPVVMTLLQAQQRHQYLEGLKPGGQLLGISNSTVQHLQDSLDDEDDYVIIERSPSSSAAGSKSCGQSSSTARPLFQPLQPPPPTTVPLLISRPEALPHATGSCCPLSESMGEVQFTAGLPRFEALRRVAFLLEDLAAARQQHSAYADALAFRLLALQVLSIATEAMEQVGVAPESSGTVACSDDIALCTASDLAACMHMIADRAEQVGMALQAHAASIQQALPDVWELVYQAALEFSKSAAVDELLASHLASLKSYTKAGALFYFMLVDGKDLPLEPKLHLSRADQRRLQRYTACVALRHQGCLALLSTSSASRNAELHPRLTERGAAPFGATPLQASMSAHPPLQGQAAV